MKRKDSISNPRPPLRLLRASPLRVLHAVQGSEVQLPCSTPQRNNDGNCWKRIKVRELDCDRPFTCRRDASPTPLKESSNNAKTSEFAFFKKFKKDASLRLNSSLLRQKELQSKKFKSSNCFRERTSPVKNFCKDFTSHLLVENVTPVNLNSMHSPLDNSSKISGKQNGFPTVTRALCFIEAVDVKDSQKTLEDTQRRHGNMEKNGTLHTHSDIFSRKRQKLRQFIENMSFHGTGESYETRYGVISLLLNRLIPESNQYRFDNNLPKLQWLPGRCFSRLDYGHYLNNNSALCCLNKSRAVFSHSDLSANSEDNNFHLEYIAKESDCKLEEKITLLDVNGSPFTVAAENYRSLISSRVKPLYDQLELPQEPEALLLGWDIDNVKDESACSSQITKSNTYAKPPTSFADDHQPNLHESFGAVGLCLSPSSNHRNLYSFPCSSLASYQIHGSSRHNTEKMEDIDAYFNNVHLNFSYVPKCPSQCDNYIDHRGSNNFCTQSAHWVMNNVFDDGGQYPFIKCLCASGLVFDFGCKYFSGSREHCQAAYRTLELPFDGMKPTVSVEEECDYGSSDDVWVEDWLPFIIQPESLFQKGKVCPLLTDKLGWNAAINEINDDITEMDCT